MRIAGDDWRTVLMMSTSRMGDVDAVEMVEAFWVSIAQGLANAPGAQASNRAASPVLDLLFIGISGPCPDRKGRWRQRMADTLLTWIGTRKWGGGRAL